MSTLRATMAAVGIDPGSDPIADGQIHRFHLTGDKRGSRNGWYLLHADHPVNAVFGSHKQPGTSHRWCPSRDEVDHRLLPARRSEKSHQPPGHQHLWNTARPARDTHPYLVRKGVPSLGLRYSTGALLVPVRDLSGTLHGLQKIWPDGAKRFTSGTEKKGNHFRIDPSGSTETVLVCEGYATGASLHLATGHQVVVAFDAGNLLPVVAGLRARHPACRLVVCADNDDHLEGNVGVSKATEASDITKSLLVIPPRGDFNDLHEREGLHAVRQLIAEAQDA